MVVLGGRVCVVDLDEKVAVPANGEWTVRVHWPPATVLHLVDAVTGSELDGVTIARTGRWTRDEFEHPGEFGETQVVRRDLTSPISLAAPPDDSSPRWQDVLFARAPGHAWARVIIDYRYGSELRVPLSPSSADLDVTIRDSEPPAVEAASAAVVLRLRREESREPTANAAEAEAEVSEKHDVQDAGSIEDDARALEQLIGDLRGPPSIEVTVAEHGPTTVSGVVAGSYLVSVEIGDWFGKPMVLGERRVELRAGATERITIALKSPRRAARVPLAGTLLVAPEWGEIDFELELSIQDRPDLRERTITFGSNELRGSASGDGSYHWDAGLVAPGDYSAKIQSFAWQRLVRVGDQGKTDVQIVIGPPADVTLHFVDEVTGDEVDVNHVEWSSETTMFSSHTSRTVEPLSGKSRYAFKAPAGRLYLSWLSKFQLGERVQHVDAGVNDITIRVARPSGVVFTLSENARPLSFPTSHFFIKVEPADGSVLQNIGTSTSQSHHAITVDPGRYRITIPRIPGFREVAPFEIDIRKGEMIERDIELVREP
jgi:hypothetical protein